MDGWDDVAALGASIAAATAGHGDLDAAIADFHRLPPGLPGRGELAAGLVEALMRTDPMSDLNRLRGLDALLRIADAEPPSTPGWARTRTTAEVLSLMRAVADREVTDFAAVTARLDALSRGADPGLEPLFTAARTSVRFARAVTEGDPGAMARLPSEVEAMLAAMPQGDPRIAALRDLLTAGTGAMAANDRGDDLTAALDQYRQLVQRLPPGELRNDSDDTIATLSLLAGMIGDGGQGVSEAQLDELRVRAEQPGLSEAERSLRRTAVAAAALGGGRETDLGRVDQGVAGLRRTLEQTAADDPLRVFHLVGLALALMRRGELTNATADLQEARTFLDQARTLAGGPQHPQWQMLNEMLADVRRLLGDGLDVHQSAVEGLRAHVWRVLVQPDLAGATAAARTAADDAMEAARKCLVAEDPASALRALDAGRGLALFAATEVGSLADRLDEAGDPELAQRWRTAAAAHDPQRLPPDLRRAVMEVLAKHSSAAGLLDAPTYGEVQQALTALDADALIYLVPATKAAPGYAVAASAIGAPAYLALPNLGVGGDDRTVVRYLAALPRGLDRDVGGEVPGVVDADEAATLEKSLDELCSWAWAAAIGPLVESYLPRLTIAESGRVPRVVLVPMGDLALVPWQAARGPDGRYAVERIAISQAASARMLCRSAALEPVALGPLGLLVGDPDTTTQIGLRPTTRDLPSARLEAFGIRQSFYRGARYVGRRPDGTVSPSGAGTKKQVRDWLLAAGPDAGAMLHLACHGDVRSGAARQTAYLLLAGGETLTAEELVALMAQAPERGIALVVLAACRTGLPMSGYDEAYSLGTAFLAGRVRSVLSTQWKIPDRDTSVLMYLVHHHLNAGMPVWKALREAQLWALRADRQVPEGMPPPLRSQVGTVKLDAVVSWAGFVHWGQ